MPLDSALHKNILIQILKDIYTDTTLAPILGFKGGTAVYLFHDLQRFSVDLDFDLLDESKENYVLDRIGQIAKKYGNLKESRIKRFNIFFLLSYQHAAHNIKIEINRRNFGSSYDLKSYLGIGMLVMLPEDMFANKLIAMVERIGKSNRDIYDVWFFLKNSWPVNKEIVKKRTGLDLKDFLQKCITTLEKMTDHGILNGIGELIDEKQKIWVKQNLRKDTIFLLKLRQSAEK